MKNGEELIEIGDESPKPLWAKTEKTFRTEGYVVVIFLELSKYIEIG